MRRCTTKKRAPLTRDRVLRAALELADEGGTAALTMQQIGRRVGVEAGSLTSSSPRSSYRRIAPTGERCSVPNRSRPARPCAGIPGRSRSWNRG